MTYEDLLKELVTEDERYIVMTAENRAAIRNLPLILGNKFIDTGITEQTLIGSAAGLALTGRVPIVHALASFLTMRAFEFIRTDVGIGNLPVKIIGGFPGLLSEANGPTHQSIEDVSLMRGVPNVNVFCPADNEDMLICLRKVFECPNPFYIRYNNFDSGIKHDENFEIGKAEIFSEGKDIAILVYGLLFKETMIAKEILTNEGYSVKLVNIRTPKPIDEKVIIDSATSTKLLVTVEDHFLTGGLYSIVAEICLRNRLNPDVLSIAFENKWFKPALLNDVLEYENMTGEKIALRIKEKLSNKNG